MSMEPKRNASGYMYVYEYSRDKWNAAGMRRAKRLPWEGCLRLNNTNVRKQFATEREAALWVDKQLIRLGREPVNILKRKEP